MLLFSLNFQPNKSIHKVLLDKRSLCCCSAPVYSVRAKRWAFRLETPDITSTFSVFSLRFGVCAHSDVAVKHIAIGRIHFGNRNKGVGSCEIMYTNIMLQTSFGEHCERPRICVVLLWEYKSIALLCAWRYVVRRSAVIYFISEGVKQCESGRQCQQMDNSRCVWLYMIYLHIIYVLLFYLI